MMDRQTQTNKLEQSFSDSLYCRLYACSSIYSLLFLVYKSLYIAYVCILYIYIFINKTLSYN